jgi:heterodisulfide reductase subunit A-like polyferredoxin
LIADGFFSKRIRVRRWTSRPMVCSGGGVAHYPKFLDETIAQAQAAAARAAIILSQESVLTNARVAVVDNTKCVGCLTCVRVCPYDVPKINRAREAIIGAAYTAQALRRRSARRSTHGAEMCPDDAVQPRRRSWTINKHIGCAMGALCDPARLGDPVEACIYSRGNVINQI